MKTTDQTWEAAFIERIEGLEAGELASLRRGCGERDAVEGRCPWFIREIQGAARPPVTFLVASLLAQYKTSDIRQGRHRLSGNFGATWKSAIRGTDSDSIKRRFHILLDAEYDPRTGDGDLPYRLRQMVKYAAVKGFGADWPRLLKDLRGWNNPEKYVQKAWANTFFANERPEQAAYPLEETE